MEYIINIIPSIECYVLIMTSLDVEYISFNTFWNCIAFLTGKFYFWHKSWEFLEPGFSLKDALSLALSESNALEQWSYMAVLNPVDLWFSETGQS